MRPYEDDHVGMVWHDNECVYLDLATHPTGSSPFLLDDPAQSIQAHIAVHDFAEEAFATMCDKGDEIGAGPVVVVIRQPNGAAMMEVRIVFHRVLRKWLGTKSSVTSSPDGRW